MVSEARNLNPCGTPALRRAGWRWIQIRRIRPRSPGGLIMERADVCESLFPPVPCQNRVKKNTTKRKILGLSGG
jgi:hypothetical protein